MVQFNSDRLAEICRRHGVSRLRMFGSAARGEETIASDVDLIADFSVPKGFFGVIELEDVLSELFGRPVDLVTEAGLSPYMRDDVLASAHDIFHDAA
jgi:uncharacterized protein